MKITQIPIQYYPILNQLIELDDTIIEDIVQSLKIVRPTLELEALTKTVASQVRTISQQSISDILEFVISLYALSDEHEVAQDEVVIFLDNFIRNSEEFSHISLNQLERVKHRLSRLMEPGGVLFLLSRAANVILDNERIFLRSRIISDLRPIFEPDLEKGPSSASIIHTLKLEYRQGNESQEFFITLDSLDIKQLREQLERAEKKAEALKRWLEKSEVSYVEIEPG